MAEAHSWIETKPDGAARKYGITHTCRCGAAKGKRPYLVEKSCRIKELMDRFSECANCCRGGRLVTQAFTHYICRLCNRECSHANGDTPAICQECSLEKNVCRKCGASLLKIGDVCDFRPMNPSEKKERWWTTEFPVTLARPFHLDGYWWVKDARGRIVWLNGADLVKRKA